MSQKTIAFVISSLRITGGAQKVTSQLTRSLSASDHLQVHLLTFYQAPLEHPFHGHRTTLESSRLYPVPSKFAVIKQLIQRSWQIASFCRRHHIDTLISFMGEANIPSTLSKLFGNRSTIIISVRNHPIINTTRFHQFFIRWLYPHADLIIASTKHMQQILTSAYKLTSTRVIHNPIDLSLSASLSSKALPSPHQSIFTPDHFVYLTIGRRTKQKGHIYLIKAFLPVATKHPNTRLVLLAEGKPAPAEAHLIKNKNLASQIIYLSYQRNVFPFLKACQCFVLSSLWEGFPNTILEALSTNTPVISTDCASGPREILQDNRWGILTPPLPEGLAQLSQAMLNIYERKDLQQRYSHGYSRARQFDINKITQHWQEVI